MNADSANTALFGNALTCEDSQRASFYTETLTPAQAQRVCARTETSLRAIATIEDSTSEDDEGKQSLALRRIEARLELLTAMVAKLAHPTAEPEPTPLQLRWSALGARFIAETAAEEGQTGIFRTRIVPWLPEPLEIPASVLACQPVGGGYQLWLRFTPLTEGLTSALERHLFRLHRRAIAERRQQV